MTPDIRKAQPGDASELAVLMNIAGDGIPACLWEQMAGPGADVMAFAAGRVARSEGNFSYTNAHVALRGNSIAGMLLGYRLPDPPGASPPDDVPPVVRPLLELEAMVPGSWYVNAVATVAAFRGQGVGRSLMELAERLAVASNARAVSLIVGDGNEGALRLYARLGYQPAGRRPIVALPRFPHAGEWILMRKDVGP